MLNNIVDVVTKVNGSINGIVWGIPMLCLIFGTGVYFSIRTKFFQITHVKDVYENTVKGILGNAKEKSKVKNNKNALSQFQALTTALASTIGTGNITGVSTAIVVGGPGSIFWMWICAVFGMITHFAEVVLGIYYRKDDKKNGYSGGPMYYLERGVGKDLNMPRLGKILAILFATFLFLASYGTGNMTQMNSISEALKSNFGIPSIVSGVVLAAVTATIILGGIKRIGQVAEKIVPFMAIFYIIVGIIIVLLNIKNVPSVFVAIVGGAFNTKAIAGGALGYVIKRSITYGFKRGAFSNEAGLGSSVIAHSASSEKEPVKQALWGIFEVFFDTIIVCTFTSLIILSSTLKAPNFYDALKNIGKDEITVCIDQNLVNEKGEVLLVDNNFYQMPYKLDFANNAKVYTQNPQDGKEYDQINLNGKNYFIEKLLEKDTNDNSFFFGNVLRIKANHILNTDGTIFVDNTGHEVIDSIHIENINGVSLVTLAVSNRLSHFAGKLLAIAVTLFAFTTILGWSYYGTKCVEYLFGNVATYVYKGLFIIFIVIGSTMNLSLAWDIADTFNGLMAIPNLIGVLLLSGVVLKIVKNYYDRKNGKKVKPMMAR